jgi:hypothetical protein
MRDYQQANARANVVDLGNVEMLCKYVCKRE